MAKVAVYNMEGKEVDSLELNDTWWRSIRSGTKRLFFQAQQEREESSIKVCTYFKSC